MKLVTATLTILALSSVLHAATLHVPAGYPTIQSAVDAASTGDTILVASGVYNENITILNKGLTLRGAGKATTFIIGDQTKSVINFWINSSSSTAPFTLDGFSISNGNAFGNSAVYGSHGGGVTVFKAEPCTISDCRITGNRAHKGGGIAIKNSATVIIDGCDIDSNIAKTHGGGVALLGSTYSANATEIRNNRIFENRVSDLMVTTGGGGGIFTDIEHAAYIHDNEITGNQELLPWNFIASTRSGGGAIFAKSMAIKIEDNLISANSTLSHGGGILYHWNEASYHVMTKEEFSRNVISDNTAYIGGGIYMFSNDWADTPLTEFTLKSNLIVDNQAEANGGGIVVDTPENPTGYYGAWGVLLLNNTIANNTAQGLNQKAGGLLMLNSDWVHILNTIFWNNTVPGTGQYEIFDASTTMPKFRIADSIVEGGAASLFQCSFGLKSSTLDPLFIDPTNGDYHIPVDSPCVNRGGNKGFNIYFDDVFTSEYDIDLELRSTIGTGTIDIGADEYAGPLTLDCDDVDYTLDFSETNSVYFTLDAGTAHANKLYIMLAGVSGSNPGSDLPGGINLPLNWDAFTNVMIPLINTTTFQSFSGILDASGIATARFYQAPVTITEGYFMTFAYYLGTTYGYSPITFASHALSLRIIP